MIMESEGRRVVYIGLLEFIEEQIIEVGEFVQRVVIKYVFDVFNRSDVKDIEVMMRINRGEIFDFEFEVYFEVLVFVKVDVERLIDEVVEKVYVVVEKKLREIVNEG